MNETKKSNKIFIVLLACSIILILAGLAFIIFDDKPNKPSEPKSPDSETNEQTDKVEKPNENVDYLLELAKELYNNKAYLDMTQFPGETGYWMSIGDYKHRGYDMSFIKSDCEEWMFIMHFDIGNETNYEFEPVGVMGNCVANKGTSEKPDNSSSKPSSDK